MARRLTCRCTLVRPGVRAAAHGDVAAGRQRDYAVDVDPVTPTAFDNGKPRRRDGPVHRAVQRRGVEVDGGGLRQEPEALLRGVRGRHGQAGESRGEDRMSWRDQERLHRPMLESRARSASLQLQLQSSHTSRTS